eukprot:1567625-Alexandrium_andersonii.AAC.1
MPPNERTALNLVVAGSSQTVGAVLKEKVVVLENESAFVWSREVRRVGGLVLRDLRSAKSMPH